MGLTMSPGSVISQLDSMNENLQQAVSNAKMMRLNVDNFLDTGDSLVGKAYDSTRKYFRELHIPTLDAMCQCAEAMIQENNAYKNCISTYLAGVGYIDEDALVKDIEFLDNMISHAQNSSFVPMPAKMALISSLEHAKAPIKKKLKAIQGFLSASSGLYGGIPAYIALAQSGIDEMGKKDVKDAPVAGLGKLVSRIGNIGMKIERSRVVNIDEFEKMVLIRYLNKYGITNMAEQQIIISLLLDSDQAYLLEKLYNADRENAEEIDTIFNEILSFYETKINNIDETIDYIREKLNNRVNSGITYEELYQYLEYLKKFDFLFQEEIDDLVGKYADYDTITATDFIEIDAYLSDRKGLIDELLSEEWRRSQIITALIIENEMMKTGTYDSDFISGVIGNMKGESEFGGFEDAGYEDESERPEYLTHLNDHINYQVVYSDKNITEFDLMQVYYDFYVKREDKSKHKAGLGIMQWTNYERFDGLLNCYFQEIGYDIESQGFKDMANNYPQYCNTDGYEGLYLTEEQVKSAELKWMVEELNTSFAGVYDYYKDFRGTDPTTYVNFATQTIKEKYLLNSNETLENRQRYANEWNSVRYGKE